MFSPNQRSRSFVCTCLTVLAGLILVFAAESVKAASRIEVDSIRQLSVLTDEHKTKIAEYIDAQFQEMLVVTEAGELSKTVLALMETAESKLKRAEVQQSYSNMFAEGVKTAYLRAIQSLDSIENKELAESIKLSLSVVVGSTDNALLVDNYIELMSDASPVIRYWGVKGVSGPRMQSYMISEAPEAVELTSQVLSALTGMVGKETSGLVISQIAAAAPISPDSIDLIQACVNKRVEQYQSWDVENEIADTIIIDKALAILSTDIVRADSGRVSRIVRAMTEMFSIAYQRFSVGIQYKKDDGSELVLLSDTSIEGLTSLLVEAESQLINISDANRRVRFASAIQRQNWREMENSYSSLVKAKGALDTAFKIYSDGGSDADLPKLPAPTKEAIERAITLSEIKNSKD